jgi:hypothetical protein
MNKQFYSLNGTANIAEQNVVPNPFIYHVDLIKNDSATADLIFNLNESTTVDSIVLKAGEAFENKNWVITQFYFKASADGAKFRLIGSPTKEN